MPRVRLARGKARNSWRRLPRTSEFKLALLELALGLLGIDRPRGLLGEDRRGRQQDDSDADAAAGSYWPERKELTNNGIACRCGISLQKLPQTR